MSLPERLLLGAASVLPPRRLAGRRVVLPYYHLVSDERLAHLAHLFPYKGVAAFTRDIEELDRAFRAVDPDALAALAARGGAPERASWLLSFDDGLREAFEVAAPILERKGIPAVFFLSTDYLGNARRFARHRVSLLLERLAPGPAAPARRRAARAVLAGARRGGGSPEAAIRRLTPRDEALIAALEEALEADPEGYFARHPPFMGEEQARDLQRRGFTLGSHGAGHERYSELSLAEQVAGTSASLRVLRERFGVARPLFSLPHGDAGVGRSFFARVLAGPDGPPLVFGTAGARDEDDPRVLHRVSCENPVATARGHLNAALLAGAALGVLGRRQVRRAP